MAYELMAAQTGAATSEGFRTTFSGGMVYPASFVAKGLAGVETVDVEVSNDGGVTFQTLYLDGVQTQLTATNVMFTLFGPGIYRAVKGVTAGAAGVGVSSGSNL
jgi:hypothetical protein